MASFEGRVVIITGAASGIGRATAIKMARVGANLALADINADGLASTLQECIEAGEKPKSEHFTSRLDVSLTEEIERFIQSVVSKYGTINHVFNCAGINPTKFDIEEISDEYWHRLMDTNLKSVFAMTRACVPYMKSGSSFVNVSSTSGLSSAEGLGVYCATKYAVIGFSRCMALDLGKKGIRVNILCPGSILTPTNRSVVAGPEKVALVGEAVGLKRFGIPEEIADVVAFLFSDESRYMNGSVVEVDGGR
jgi:NAD(P)-dependent dehydrogenase (short-subunit alcohol dehydrogenase family)